MSTRAAGTSTGTATGAGTGKARGTGTGKDRAAPGAVSATSAQRFAAKVHARRRRRLLIGAGAVALLAVAAWAVLWSSWSTVETIQVTGTHRVSTALVRAAGEREAGQPLLLARVGQVRAEVAAQRLVRSVRVTRHWPSVLRIDVVEREPVAAVPIDGSSTDNSIGKSSTSGGAPAAAGRPGAPMRLVDPDGVTIATTSQVPAGIPVLNVDPSTSRGVPALRACLSVLAGLPPPIRAQVAAAGAVSPDGVWLRLTSGARVQWGGADRGALKASVLTALLKQPAVEYDLRAPDNPAVRRK